MQQFAVIGLGRFGSRLAMNLAAAGQEVIAIDRKPEIVQSLRDRVTLAVALDATDEGALRSQGVAEVAAAVVGIGNDFEATVLTTVVLKHLGVKKVIARARSRTSARVLERIGADAVVLPEDESADRWADRLVSPQYLSQFELEQGYSIVELGTPAAWAGRTLADLHLRAKHRLHVVAIKRLRDQAQPQGPRWIDLPRPDDPLRGSDALVIMGADKDLARIPRDAEDAKRDKPAQPAEAVAPIEPEPGGGGS